MNHGERRQRRTGAVLGAVLLVLTTGTAATWSWSAPASPPPAIPLRLESFVQQSIGSSDASFSFRHQGALWTASGAGIHSVFGSGGVRLGVAGRTVDLRLVAMEADGRLTALPQVAPVAAKNVVRYRRGAVTEWYRNGPFGLEQGFTIDAATAGDPATTSLVFALSSSLHARRTDSGVAFLSRAGGPMIDYDGLSAEDASGRPVSVTLVLSQGRLILRLRVRNPRYPLRVDPFIQIATPLSGNGESGGAGFGVSVALSADDDTALIGGDSDDDNNGAAWVFTRSGARWIQQGSKLTEPAASATTLGAGLFGASVALSANGNLALIGAPDTNDFAGAAWVFTRSGDHWTQSGKVPTPRGESGGAWFGASVALSDSGHTLLIGGPLDADGTGAAWMYTRIDSKWEQDGGKLTAAGAAFGTTVALSAAGTTAMIGGNNAVWAYTKTTHGWVQVGKKLTAPGGDFGSAVALSANGSTALIGDYSLNGPGAAWIYTRARSTWKPAIRLVDANKVRGAQFGSSVALSADGTTALISGPLDDGALGAAWVFRRSGATWTQAGPQITGSGETQGANFGSSVALSANGATALIGGQYDNQSVGAAWVFQDPR